MKRQAQLFTEIAREHLGIATLETRNCDSLDFHDLSVRGVSSALKAAFDAGAEAAATAAPTLLAALEGALYALDENRDGSGPSKRQAIKAARAAIAGARAAGIPTSDVGSLPVRFDAYEVHGVREFDDGNGKYCEQVPDEEAQFWSLYGHIPRQGLDCIGDFKTRERAEEFYARITGRPYGSRT
jgi:hypothetical protein